MQIQNVPGSELEDLGFSDDEICLIQTADRTPNEMVFEQEVSLTTGEPIFDGEKVLFQG